MAPNAASKFVETAADGWTRRRWQGVLAKADSQNLVALVSGMGAPAHASLREPEIGMVMVRGRAGGAGDAFNLGEMTVTRAAVRLGDGIAGVGYVSGRSRDAARAAALVDAMMQTEEWRAAARDGVLAPLERAAQDRRSATQAKTAATKVEFFTMVRTREHQ